MEVGGREVGGMVRLEYNREKGGRGRGGVSWRGLRISSCSEAKNVDVD